MMEMIWSTVGLALGIMVTVIVERARKKALVADMKAGSLEREKEFQRLIAESDKSAGLAAERLNDWKHEMELTEGRLEEERTRNLRLERELAALRIEKLSVEEKLEKQVEELDKLQKRFTLEFENIASKILRENSREFTSVNQKNIGELLNPLREKINSFERKVEDTYTKGLKDQTDLRAELKKLQELNHEISSDAKNLTQALKGDVKKQGNWGEVILERVLERSGLTEGREFHREVVDENNEGKTIRPDVIVNLPDKKHIIIDSKVSLVAYERFVNSGDESEREQALRAHLQSLRTHIKTLSEKHYPTAKSLNTPDFVLLFLPVESSFSTAVQHDADIFNYAWEKKVVIVSPSTLLASLRTISSIWKQENQTRNAIEIARQGGALYDKVVGFIQDMERIGKGLENAHDNWEKAIGKLHTGRGNLVRTAEKIKELGAKTSKEIPDKYISEETQNRLN